MCTTRRPELSDDFLRQVVNILNLPNNFRYSLDTMHTTVNVTSLQKSELKRLCDKNRDMIITHNGIRDNEPIRLAKVSDIYFSNWSYGVLKNYFDIYV